MYRVIKAFRDLKDNRHEYAVGDVFPHAESVVETFKADRINELITDQNATGEALIVKAEDYQDPIDQVADKPDEPGTNEFPKHIGGGNYELSNGEKVKGKANAIAAEEALQVE